MSLKLYNTSSRKIENFKPQKEGYVSLYTCGPTVYNYLHVGNWVAYIRWDILVRTLKLHGYAVERVMNITDVGHLVSDADEGEDKMLKGARREGVSMFDIAQRYTDDFLRSMKELGLLEPAFITKATDFIPEQLALVERLEQAGFTYVIDDGVYFDTSKFPSYASFARLDLAGLRAGARVSASEGKRNPSDFALWKFDVDDRRIEMVWDSKWGRGFPGWHLECSAMAMAKLGETIDIHTGGIDHIPVHHTNEIAQSEAATGKQFANYWLHANFLMVNGTKISKSLGNGYTLNDLSKQGFGTDDFKMFVLQSHYRSESNFTWENLSAAKSRLERWKTVSDLTLQLTDGGENALVDSDKIQAVKSAVQEALASDLDTPKVLAAVDGLFSDVLQQYAVSDIQQLKDFLLLLDQALGTDLSSRTGLSERQQQLFVQRQEARLNKDWARSDELREELAAEGVSVNDTPRGQFWSRV